MRRERPRACEGFIWHYHKMNPLCEFTVQGLCNDNLDLNTTSPQDDLKSLQTELLHGEIFDFAHNRDRCLCRPGFQPLSFRDEL